MLKPLVLALDRQQRILLQRKDIYPALMDLNLYLAYSISISGEYLFIPLGLRSQWVMATNMYNIYVTKNNFSNFLAKPFSISPSLFPGFKLVECMFNGGIER